MQRKGGYTLLEVLIASLLFSLIVFLAVYSFNQVFLYYNIISKRGIDFSQYMKILWLYQSTSAIIDYYVFDEDKKYWFPLFIGEPDRLIYVTASPLSVSLPTVVILRRETGNNYKYQLTYEEIPVYGKNWSDIRHLLTGIRSDSRRNPIVLIDDLDSLKISYYGFDFSRRVDMWTESYDGRKKLRFPSIIRIEYTRNQQSEEIILPVQINTNWKLFYNEMLRRF